MLPTCVLSQAAVTTSWLCQACHLAIIFETSSPSSKTHTRRPLRLQTCSKCNEEKPKSEFYASKYLSSGLHSQCKRCVRAGQEKRVRCNPEQAATEKTCRCAAQRSLLSMPPIQSILLWHCTPLREAGALQPEAGRHREDLPVRREGPLPSNTPIVPILSWTTPPIRSRAPWRRRATALKGKLP
jgi:hypothetical protein